MHKKNSWVWVKYKKREKTCNSWSVFRTHFWRKGNTSSGRNIRIPEQQQGLRKDKWLREATTYLNCRPRLGSPVTAWRVKITSEPFTPKSSGSQVTASFAKNSNFFTVFFWFPGQLLCQSRRVVLWPHASTAHQNPVQMLEYVWGDDEDWSVCGGFRCEHLL